MNTKAHIKTILDHVWGPTGSAVFHILALILLIRFAGSTTALPPLPVETTFEDIKPAPDLETFETKLDEAAAMPQAITAVQPPEVSIDREPPRMDSPVPGRNEAGPGGETASAGARSEDPSARSANAEENDASLAIATSVGSFRLRNLFAGRGEGGREAGLKEYSDGHGARTEYAVKKALQWLKKHQYPDGSWGPAYRPAMTGLALLAFLAHNEVPSSPEYGETVRQGLKYLLSVQKNGVFFDGYCWPYYSEQVSAYEHAIATYAMSEAYGLTGIPFLKTAMEDAAQVIIDGQHEAGGWDYGYRRGPEAHVDVSLSGWHIQALKAAQSAGAENPGLKTAIESGIAGLKAMVDRQGRTGMFRYSTRQARPPDAVMTGVAVLCMQLTGHAMDKETRDGMSRLKDLQFRWSKGEAANQDLRGVADWPMYAWYYITQARFQQGPLTWRGWNNQFAPALCGLQNPDGSWCPAPQCSEAGLGPVYCTALPALMLEVYYRFLPTYKAIPLDDVKPAAERAEEERVVVRFG